MILSLAFKSILQDLKVNISSLIFILILVSPPGGDNAALHSGHHQYCKLIFF